MKEDAYKPDWSEPARLAYTDHLADLLSALLPAGQEGSVSTVPCTFKPWAEGREDAITENLIRHVAHLVAIARKTGQTLALSLEPEPCCQLETIDETIAFFKARLFDRRGVARLAALSGLAGAEAEAAMRRHIGVCYDVCHAAVEFEDPRASIAQLRASGIRIAKLQLSSALRVASLDSRSARHLAAFAEPALDGAGVARGRLTEGLDQVLVPLGLHVAQQDAIASLRAQALTPDIYSGSPCLFCLQSFGKTPWRVRGRGQSAAQSQLVSIRGQRQ